MIASVVAALIVGMVLGLALAADVDSGTVPPTTTAPDPFPTRDSVGVPDEVTLEASTVNVIDVDGTVVAGALIDGGLVVRADDVTVRDSRIRGNRRLVVECDGCTNLQLERVELVGTGDSTQACVGRTNYTLRDSLVAGCIDGAKANGNVTIEGNWIGDLRRVGSSSHNDGVQSTGGDRIVIQGNTIVHATGGQTSAVKITSENQPATNVEIANNRLTSSTCRAVYFTKKDPWPAPTGQVVGNIVSGHTCPDWLALDEGPGQVIEGNEVAG